MTRRAPFLGAVRGPFHRGKRGSIHLGDFVLQQLQVGISNERRVLAQIAQRVGGGGEGVHEDEADIALKLLAESHHLLRSQIEEGVRPLDGQQGLRLVQPHAGPQATVQLKDDSFFEQLGVNFYLGLEVLLEVGEPGRGSDVRLGDDARGARDEGEVRVLEGGDRGVAEIFLAHLRLV